MPPARPVIDAAAVIAALRETDARCGGRREAWRSTWAAERERLDARARAGAREADLVVERDAFANTWYVLPGDSTETVLVHSHSDCVPGGGWLDGILGVHAGLGLLAAVADRRRRPPRTLAVVDWADEEGTRFGRSLLGSAAATGALTRDELAALRADDGRPATEIIVEHGFDLDALGTPSPRLSDVVAAIELHIEQGPELERSGRATAVVQGCLGVRRRRITFTGRPGHAGTIAMAQRHDPARAAADLISQTLDAAEREGGLATAGELAASPEIITAVPAECRVSLDIRHHDLAALQRLDAGVTAQLAAMRCASDDAEVFGVDPVDFDPGLVTAAARHVEATDPMRSGALHDSANLARAGIPTVMLFVASCGGVSHARAEDTGEADLHTALGALGDLAGDLLGHR